MTEEARAQTTEEKTEAAETPEPFKAFSSKKEHDDYLEARLKERLERKDKKLAEEREETERKAREQALRDQENWQKLAEEREQTITTQESRIGELKAVEGERDAANERVSALEERLKGVIKPRLEAVPELYRSFVESMTVEKQAEWFEQNGEKLAPDNPTDQRPRGSRPTGQTQRPGEDDAAAKRAREEQRQRTMSAL